MKYITFLIAFCLVAGGSEIAVAQSGNPSTSVKFILKNGAGNLISLSSPASGVTNYSLTVPPAPGAMNSLLISTDAAGTLGWLSPGSAGQILSVNGSGIPVWITPSTLNNAWSLTGNSGTTAGTNFIGTTDATDFVTKTNNSERTRLTSGGKLGIGNIIPNTTLDLNGSEALRAASLSLTSGGSNDNVVIGDTSNYRASGPSANFTITGFQNGYDGKILRLFNTTASIMTIAHQNPGSTDTCRIFNPELKDLKIADSGAVDLMYDAPMHRWVVRNYIAGTTVTFPSIQFRRALYDSVATSTTLRTQSDISFTVLANQIVTFEGVLLLDADKNADVALAWDAPMGTGAVMKMTQNPLGDDGIKLSGGTDIVTAANTNSAAMQVFAGTTTFVRISGLYINGPNDGKVTLKFGLSNQGLNPNLTLDQNSWIRMMVVQ